MDLTLSEKLTSVLHDALRTIALTSGADAAALPMDRLVFGPSKSPEHGDMATSAALILAKPMQSKPLDVAEKIAEALRSHPFIASAEIAKPGFVNVHLAPEAFASVMEEVSTKGASYGTNDSGAGKKVLLEFVSANPTGPMHIGHCRHGAGGDAIARLLSANGYEVTKEFYINDAGVQVKALGTSFRWRCLEALGGIREGDLVTEEVDGKEITKFRGELIQYSGEYLAEFAKNFVADKDIATIDAMTRDELAWVARGLNLEMIKNDLAALGVVFDRYVSEKTIHDGGEVEKTLEKLKASGRTYEKEGAVWLKTEDFGDDQDRVLVKGDGEYTYLVPDIAYHGDKFARGYDLYVNLFGADHGGYPPRLRAGIATLGYDHTLLNVLLMRLVFLMREGKRVKFSKRAGNFVAMSEVVEEAGPDATRWFMLARSIDSEFEFDMDLALDHSSRNPVFKVLYAHARICSMADRATEEGEVAKVSIQDAAKELSHPHEKSILLYLASFPEIIQRAGAEFAPHHLPSYLLGLAELLNSYYSLARTDQSFRILQDDNKPRQASRLLLLQLSRQVLANGLDLMGIKAPERMSRADEEEE